jgi:putative nucleotidyltransferase with HDIG domain
VGHATATGVDLKAVALGNLDKLPPFSPMLHRLMATLADEEASFASLAETIEKDSVLAGHVLRVVNSALYARTRTVSSVRHAVSLLGVVKLRNLTTSLAVTKLWTQIKFPHGCSLKRFNLHSVATALMADLLATHVAAPYPEGAFTAGLLHDVGKLLIAVSLPQQYESVERACWALVIEEEFLGTNHAELSYEILSRWRLPVPIQEAVAAHHSTSRDAAHPVLADLVALADEFAILSGCSTDSRPPGNAEASLAGWGIDEEVPAVCAEFHTAYDGIQRFF